MSHCLLCLSLTPPLSSTSLAIYFFLSVKARVTLASVLLVIAIVVTFSNISVAAPVTAVALSAGCGNLYVGAHVIASRHSDSGR